MNSKRVEIIDDMLKDTREDVAGMKQKIDMIYEIVKGLK